VRGDPIYNPSPGSDVQSRVLHFSCHRAFRVRRIQGRRRSAFPGSFPVRPPSGRSRLLFLSFTLSLSLSLPLSLSLSASFYFLLGVYVTLVRAAAIEVTIPPAVGASIATPCCLPPRNSADAVYLPSKIHSGPTLGGACASLGSIPTTNPSFSLSAIAHEAGVRAANDHHGCGISDERVGIIEELGVRG